MAELITEHYPYEDEIEAFFNGDFIKLSNTKAYFQKLGIIFVSFRGTDVSQYASRMFYSYEDFEMMKSITAIKQKNDRVSGFIMRSEKPISELGEVIHNGETVNEKEKLVIEKTIYNPNEDTMTVHFSYTRITPGKMDLVTPDGRTGDFVIENGTNGEINVIFNHCKNEDYGAVKKILEHIGQDANVDIGIVPLTLDTLDIQHRIQLIDQILAYEYADWTLEEVQTIRVKREEAGTEEDVEAEYLDGINDAILHGHNLRENQFVISCENSGYYFPSIKIVMIHKTKPFKVSFDIQFKMKPEMPEISITDSVKIEDESEENHVLDMDFKKAILNQFFKDLIIIYNDVLSGN